MSDGPPDGCEVGFRVLGPGDVPTLHALLSVFGRAFADPDGYDRARPGDEYLAGLLNSPGFVALAAVRAGRVVGGLAAYVLPKFEQARSEVYVYDLAVDEPFRRRGVAAGLIEALRTVAAERGAWVVFVQADPDDAAAVALYTKFGAREDVAHFDIPLRHDGPPGA